jgi:hypothetical protein
MATNYTNTLAGLLKLNDLNMADIYPSNVLDDAPVIAQAFAVPASQGGTLHNFLQRTTAAGVGFRDIGSGSTNAAETFTDVSVVCRILDASFERDVALADGYRKGRAAYVEKETKGSLSASMFALEQALFKNYAGGFAGLLQDTNYNVITGTQTQVIDGGGAGKKSVWLLRWSEDDIALVAGNDGNISMLWDDDSPTIVRVTDANGSPYSAYRVTMQGYFGLQIGSKYSACRIANLDGTEGHTLTDTLIAQAMARFPATRKPNMIVMGRDSQAELQASRTATNPTGAPAPFPENAFGIPIVVTDALPIDEATVNSTTTATTHTTQTS